MKTKTKVVLALVIFSPYLSMACMFAAYQERGYWAFGAEWFIPLVIFALVMNLSYSKSKKRRDYER